MTDRDGWLPPPSEEWRRDKQPEHSEDRLALGFSERHADDLRHVARWSAWFEWARDHWRRDETVRVFDLARAYIREALPQEKSIRAAMVAAVVSLARSDRRHAVEAADLDADLTLLGAQGVTIDLLSGAPYASRPDDLITKVAAVAPGGECPQWLAFLDRIFAGNFELINYMQRVAGYCLTGETSEQCLFFLYGTGANGKSVFTNTIAGIMGNYAGFAPMETFIETKQDRHPTELAMLRGLRLVIATETHQGRRWNEQRIKAMTGGEKIAARFMHADFFEFEPRFKIVILGNHKPTIANAGEAMRRRIHLVPFTVTIPPAERDLQLADKLKAEWPGILQWMIRGTLTWRAMGLAPPKAVLDATAAYLAEQDSIGQWLAERCEQGRPLEERSSTLYGNWKAWAEAAGEKPGTQRSFSQSLHDRGFSIHHTRDGNVVQGIKVKAP